MGVWTFINTLAHTTTVSIRGASGTTSTHGPDTVRVVWIVETAVIALAPVLGALWSPVARRRMFATAA